MTDMNDECHYSKGDLRRMLAVVGAIDALGDSASMTNISVMTGLARRTVCTQVRVAIEQAGMEIVTWTSLRGRVMIHTIENWGPYIKKSGAKFALEGCLSKDPKEGQA